MRSAADTGRRLLDRVSLEIEAGHPVELQGASGSGKTLLLRALALLDPLQGGEVLWRGQPIADRAVPRFRSQILYLQQRPTLVAGTVEENLSLPASFRCHRGRPFDRQRSIALLEQLGRGEELLRRRTEELSGGERQLVAFVRALLLEPEVLLLDEPSAALDPDAATRLAALIESWCFGGRERSYLWVRHGEPGGDNRRARVLRMERGRLITDPSASRCAEHDPA